MNPTSAQASTAPTLSSVPGLDYALGLAQLSGNVAVYEKLLYQFMDGAKRELATLDGYLGSDETDQARKIAHSLKGSAGTLGAMRMHEHCARLENALRGGTTDTASLRMLFAELVTEAETLSASIKETRP